jgi:Protein of unknown function (DUF4058)
MTLLDHFRSPLSSRRHWHSFHNAWATYLAEDLNQRLPQGYFAESNVQFGIEIDVAAFEEEPFFVGNIVDTDWQPSPPTQVVPFESALVEQVEVGIFSSDQSTKLIGAIEIVSPANKDRPSQREVFVTKCQSYLEQGVGLIVIDIVTTRKQSLHTQLMEQIGGKPQPSAGDLYAAAYRSIVTESPQVEIWFETLAIDQSLPTLPLWLKEGGCFPVDLAQTYDRTCKAQRI